MLEAIGAADRDSDLAHSDGCGIAEPAPRNVADAHLEHGEIGIRVVADDVCARGASIGQRDFDRCGACGDVTVRDEVSVRRDQESRSSALLPTARSPLAFDTHVRNGGRDERDRSRDGLRIRVEKRRIGYVRGLAGHGLRR